MKFLEKLKRATKRGVSAGRQAYRREQFKLLVEREDRKLAMLNKILDARRQKR